MLITISYIRRVITASCIVNLSPRCVALEGASTKRCDRTPGGGVKHSFAARKKQVNRTQIRRLSYFEICNAITYRIYQGFVQTCGKPVFLLPSVKNRHGWRPLLTQWSRGQTSILVCGHIWTSTVDTRTHTKKETVDFTHTANPTTEVDSRLCVFN